MARQTDDAPLLSRLDLLHQGARLREGFDWNKVDNTCRVMTDGGAELDTNYEYYSKIIPS